MQGKIKKYKEIEEKVAERLCTLNETSKIFPNAQEAFLYEPDLTDDEKLYINHVSQQNLFNRWAFINSCIALSTLLISFATFINTSDEKTLITQLLFLFIIAILFILLIIYMIWLIWKSPIDIKVEKTIAGILTHRSEGRFIY